METFNSDDFLNFDNLNDESETSTVSDTQDTVPQTQESVTIKSSKENTDQVSIDTKDSLSAKTTTSNTEQIPQATDSFKTQSSTETKDQINLQQSDNIEIITNKTNETDAYPQRIDPKSVKTDEDAEAFFISEVARRYRFFSYLNALENLRRDEVLDALYDALEEINETTPQSDYSLLKLVTRGQRYRRVLILGAAKYCVITLISHWTSDGIDVTVEDLSVSSKLGDFQSLLSTITDQFTEKLKELKAYDRLAIRTSQFSTGARRFSTVSSVTRVSRITTGGRRIG